MVRSRRTKVSAEEKTRLVLAVLANEMTCAQAARRCGVAGAERLEEVPGGPAGKLGNPEQRRLRMENEQLKLALAEATVQLRIWQRGAAFADQVPSSTYRRQLARLRHGAPIKGPWPAPTVDRIEAVAAKYAEAWPAWGYRKIAALMRADGHQVTNSSVARALHRRGLLLPQGFRADRKSWAVLRRKVFRDPPTQRNRSAVIDYSPCRSPRSDSRYESGTDRRPASQVPSR